MSSPIPGRCCACDRPVGRAFRVCPYCGDAIFASPASACIRRLAPWLLSLIPLGAALSLTLAGPAGWPALAQRLLQLAAKPWSALGLALVLALALPPTAPPTPPGAPPSTAGRGLLAAMAAHLALALAACAAACAALLGATPCARLAGLALFGALAALPASVGFGWRALASGVGLGLLLLAGSAA